MFRVFGFYSILRSLGRFWNRFFFDDLVGNCSRSSPFFGVFSHHLPVPMSLYPLAPLTYSHASHRTAPIRTAMRCAVSHSPTALQDMQTSLVIPSPCCCPLRCAIITTLLFVAIAETQRIKNTLIKLDIYMYWIRRTIDYICDVANDKTISLLEETTIH